MTTILKSVYLRVTLVNPYGQDFSLTPEGVRQGVANALAESSEFLCPTRVELCRPPHTELEDVRDFHTKFGVPMADRPAFLEESMEEFRTKFMQEELNEFSDACGIGNMEKAADALVDLVYVVIGTALMMGLPWPELWAEVQRANMEKRRAVSASESKRGSTLDVVKPEGWRGPDHLPALQRAMPLCIGMPFSQRMRAWPVFMADGSLSCDANSEGGEL